MALDTTALGDSRAFWDVPSRDLEMEERLVEALGVPSLVAAVLVRRGIGDPAVAEKYLNPQLSDLHAPSALPDFEAAARAILGAKERGEQIYVHGDYDVDGVSSTALMTRFLKKVGCQVVPHVPHRMKEGYGIHLDAVKWAKEQGSGLFLTCDCGISAHEQLDAVYAAGMKAVVTDHHEPKRTMPRAEAVVNPHRPDSDYPYPHLAGAGVVFKLCEGVSRELAIPLENYYRAYLDLAVLGTVADMMPLTGENRVITKFGLEKLTVSKKPGVRALIQVSGCEGRPLVARDIGFRLGPRINAVGRIDDASVALDMFLTDDDALAKNIAEYLDRRNTERRDDQAAMVDRATEKVLEGGLDQRMVIVVGDKEWHPGIIGIVAGKLCEKFRRPTFVVALGEDGVGKGSARSIPGFNLAQAIDAHQDILLGGGGHAAAAGISLLAENLDVFGDRLHEYASGFLTPDDFRPVLSVDAEVSLAEAGPLAGEAMQALQPFGMANEEPLFVVRNVRMTSMRKMSNPAHAFVTFTDGVGAASGVVWGMAEELEGVGTGQELDLAFKLELNEYKGRREIRWSVQDYRVRG